MIAPPFRTCIVSIHAPARGATGLACPASPCEQVSIHAPARGATITPARVRALLGTFQSTPPRAGRLSGHAHGRVVARVSIHAPARGATYVARAMCDAIVVSIHAPARGATSARRPVHAWPLCFNPRPRAGGDDWSDGEAERIMVSIHAPARGATRPSVARPLRQCFNPRPRAGGDPASFLTVTYPAVSIHAPARGATWAEVVAVGRDDPVSIHAPARGATALGASVGAPYSLFQSTPPRGGRRPGGFGPGC